MSHLNSRKIISILLMVVITIVLISSCNSSNDTSDIISEESILNSQAESAETSTDEYKDASGNYVSKREVVDWEEREFTILVRGEAFVTYQSDDFTTGSVLYGELLDDAVTKRNDRV
ncbi:MAG: hypothetical protein A2Y17_07190 [Clostridiales bacterium GWF2_38_85]|nr:MAG: hypothetical protein A2Y17_07190 [Clostridiales bacterium GWF2_38_85]HBL84997.1 hypothetical protein [Clostridiales bacterium]